MSIVERALQKAQQQAQTRPQQAAAEPSPPLPPAPAPGPADARPARSSRPVAPADPSATERDLKAMVHVDFGRLRAEGRLPSQDMAPQVEEEMRRIKWPLLNAISGHGSEAPARNNVILVTSALPGEGKSFTSLSLALSIARDREMRVILVDGDVARPGLTPSLGLEGRPGLNDVLADEDRDVDSVVYQTDVDGLFFVPAGQWFDQSPEFFAGSRMPQVIDALTQRVGNGVVVLDSPPLLATNEAQVVTRYVGQVLLVVHADQTEQRAVLDAIELVDKATPVNAVLNRVKASAMSKYYGHYYYGYGSGYGSDYRRGRKKNEGEA